VNVTGALNLHTTKCVWWGSTAECEE